MQDPARRNALLEGALNSIRHGLIAFAADGRLAFMNRKAYELYDLDPEAVGAGSTVGELVAHASARGNFAGRPVADVLAELRLPPADVGDVCSWAAQGGRTVVMTRRRLADGGWVTTHEDVTDRRRSEEQQRFLERHDLLTGLPNRLQLSEHIADRIGAPLALLCIDVRRMRSINGALGYEVGDCVLRQAADRLRLAAGAGEFTARIEGDRFAVVQSGAARPDDAAALARRIIRVLSEPYAVAGDRVVVGASVGCAFAPSDAQAPEALLRSAHLALIRAKAEPPGGWHFFAASMEARTQARRALERDLRAALDGDQFEVWYQPLLDARTRRVTGFEALARWRHPVRGIVGPAEFIPVAEEIGVIQPLGAWVLRAACAEARAWPPHLRLAVNLSSVQFRNADLVRTVVEALDRAGLPAGRLNLEITESVLLERSEETLATLHELRGLGVCISMDDFGTGHSSLSYLRRFPFDRIKIDRSFVCDLSDRADSLAIVRAVVSLGRALGMATTAEGVETGAQLARLSSEGCTEVQGFLFSPPRPGRDLPELLRRLAGAADEMAA